MSASSASASPVAGWGFSGQTSQRTNATLSRSGERLFVTDATGAQLTSALIEDVVVEQRLGSIPQKVVFPGGYSFETQRLAEFDALIGGQSHSWLSRLETFHPRLVVFVALAILAAGLVYRYGLALLVTAAVAVTPKPLLVAMDTGTLRTLDLTITQPSNLEDSTKAEIQSVFQQLVTTLPSESVENLDIELVFRSAPFIGPNAAALPGGTVLVTDALPGFLEDDIDAIAGVLAHELGHVIEQHGLKQVYRSAGLFLLISFLAGDTGPMIEDVLLEGNLLLSLSYSRDAESQADAFAVKLMQEAGFDPEGLAGFFDRLAVLMPDNVPWYSTHPGSANRADAIRELAGR